MSVIEEGADTRTFLIEHMVLKPNTEVMSRKFERYIREVFTCLAFDGVSPVGIFCSTHLLVSKGVSVCDDQKKSPKAYKQGLIKLKEDRS